MSEPHRLYVAIAIENRLADAMHSIHYPPIARKNHREPQVAIHHQASVVCDLATGQPLVLPTGPVRLIQFADSRERHAFAREIPRQRDQAVNIPHSKTVWRWPGMILRAHRGFSA